MHCCVRQRASSTRTFKLPQNSADDMLKGELNIPFKGTTRYCNTVQVQFQLSSS